MNSEMVERVARAIAKDDAPDKGWEDLNAASQEVYRRLARAAILAMREPTEAILTVIESDLPADGPECEFVKDEAPDYWRAMIDAALQEDRG